MLPGRKSGFRAGFRSDYDRESLKIGPPTGRGPAGGPILRLSRRNIRYRTFGHEARYIVALPWGCHPSDPAPCSGGLPPTRPPCWGAVAPGSATKINMKCRPKAHWVDEHQYGSQTRPVLHGCIASLVRRSLTRCLRCFVSNTSWNLRAGMTF